MESAQSDANRQGEVTGLNVFRLIRRNSSVGGLPHSVSGYLLGGCSTERPLMLQTMGRETDEVLAADGTDRLPRR